MMKPSSLSKTTSFLRLLILAGILGVGDSAVGQGATLTPNSTEWPTTNWAREDANTTYAEWDIFTDAEGGDNFPDVGNFEAATATVVETSDPPIAFITSGGNIYSFAGATQFEVIMPGAGLGAGFDTMFVMQVVTLGSEYDGSTLRLSYDGGNQLLAPDTTEELDRFALGGFGGEQVTTIVSWDIAGVSPSTFLLQLNASSSSMSLDRLILDTNSTGGQSIPLPGDFDGSETVDYDDYLFWKDHLGSSDPAADHNRSGLVDLGDYTIWRNNLGASSTSMLSMATVPEPHAAALALVLVGCLGAKWNSRRQ